VWQTLDEVAVSYPVNIKIVASVFPVALRVHCSLKLLHGFDVLLLVNYFSYYL
jgi:hypothetical protein